MPRRLDGNLSFLPPTGWTEGALAVFHANCASGPVPSLHVAWEAREGGSVHAHALRRLAALCGKDSHVYDVTKVVTGRPSVGLRITVATEPVPVEVLVVVIEADPDGAVVVFSLVAGGGLTPPCREIFERVLGTFRVEARDGAPAGEELANAEEVDMQRYRYRNVSFEPPANWVETTIAAYHAPPGPDGSKSSWLVVGREPLAPAVTLRAYADRALIRLAQGAEAVSLVDTRSLMVGDRSAILVRVKMGSPEGETEKTLVMVEPGDGPPRRVTRFVMTAPLAQAEATQRALAETLSSVRFGASSASASVDAPAAAAATQPSAARERPYLVSIPGTRRSDA